MNTSSLNSPRWFADARGNGRALVVALLTSLACLAVFTTTSARAVDNPNSYGEVARIAGFDTALYDNGSYDGATIASGKFVDPTGFAVDTQDATAGSDHTALYVADRISGLGGASTSWRLQKLDDQDNVLGSTTFTLPTTSGAQVGIAGLVVDHTAGRVYALAVGNFTIGPLHQAGAQELLAWSTTPDGSSHLVAAAGLPSDSGAGKLNTTGALVSSKAQLSSGPTPLYDPQGIALDVTGAGERNIVIEATDRTDTTTGVGSSGMPGYTIVQQVATAAQTVGAISYDAGDLVGSWSAADLAGLAGAPPHQGDKGPQGISTNPDGSLTVMLNDTSGSGTTDLVKLSADLTNPVLQLDQSNVPPDFDRQPIRSVFPVTNGGGAGVAEPLAAGPSVVSLTNGLYAASYFGSNVSDAQSYDAQTAFYWHGGDASQNFVANVGVRLLGAASDGTLSDTEGATILNTLGNTTAGVGACNLGSNGASLAQGANGTLWLLMRGADTSSGLSGATAGRQIVEFAPGAPSACPQPSGTFTINGQPASATVEATLGTPVTFDASAIAHGSPVVYAYDWVLNVGDTVAGKPQNAMQEPVYVWAPSTATYTYTTPGTYPVSVTMNGDYGMYTQTGTVHVTGGQSPISAFNVNTAAPTAGQPVSFDASTSQAFNGATIANYHWSWGDGSSEDDSIPSAAHSYASAGPYSVTLTVTDSASRTGAASSPQTVNVAAADGGGGQSNPPASTGPSITPAPLGDTSPTDVSPRASGAGTAVNVALSCPKTKVSCSGSVQLKTARAVAASAHGKKAKKKTQLVLGQGSFSLIGGKSQTVSVRLSAKGRALLSAQKRLSLLVIVAAHDTLGNPKTVTVSVTVRAPAKKHKGAHKSQY
ncbi:MAG TPA: PKD domain-containing protein [Solirubrobacteraceae bacterium]|nr:PKD domain-containing protein [Solirubrobacteraceae bacterium]